MKTAPEIPEKEAEGAAYHQWFFAGAEFDERSLELRANGQLVALERKSLEVLRQLLHRAGEIATKDELLEAVWPGRILSETILAKCISRIRQVLGDEEQLIVKTVHGYGYRLMAPVTVKLSSATLPPAKLGLAAGDHPPMRPEWVLVKRLGAGGQGEVWLCRHEKLGSHRVLKFALDVSGLAAIKREITLHRLLLDSLGVREDLSTVIDWNLRETPCFIEFEYAESGNLESWAQAQGGLGTIPLSQRLDLVVRIADILAAAHSVGVLHKDLKPTNVLIGADSSGKPVPKLADFGSGGLLDPLRLDAIGITRMGFSRAAFGEDTPATALYRAPELMVGQLATVQADIYSLGVMLYQVVIGDFQQPLAPGWERNIGDPLLSEDIGLAVAGDRSRRLADAAALAERLRTLEARRAQKLREQDERARLALDRTAAEARARQAELTVTRLRARRNWMLTALSVLIVGMALSLGLFLEARRARDEAKAAAASSQAVADFLSRDMFSVVSSRPLRELSVRELLEAASRSLTTRELTPQAGAQIHGALGSAFYTMEMVDQAAAHLQQAFDLVQKTDGVVSEGALSIAAQLVLAKGQGGVEDLSPYQRLLTEGQSALGPHNLAVLELHHNIAHVRLVQGQWREAAAEFKDLLGQAREITPPPVSLVESAAMLLGYSLIKVADFAAAERVLRESLARTVQAPKGQEVFIAKTRMFLGLALMERGLYEEADREISQALELMRPWTTDEASAHLAGIRAVEGLLRLRQNRFQESIDLIRGSITALSTNTRNPKQDQSYEIRSWLAEALMAQGNPRQAIPEMRTALQGSEADLGAANPTSQGIRMELALMLLHEGDRTAAARLLDAVDEKKLAELGSSHPLNVRLRKARALLASGHAQ